jgi:hypothetical protein
VGVVPSLSNEESTVGEKSQLRLLRESCGIGLVQEIPN